jgi:hypothetical protein
VSSVCYAGYKSNGMPVFGGLIFFNRFLNVFKKAVFAFAFGVYGAGLFFRIMPATQFFLL